MKNAPICLALLALSLAACSRPSEADKAVTQAANTPPPAPSTAGMDISQPIRAIGTEPFWGLTLTDGKTITLTRPDHPDLVATAPGAAIQPGRATLVAQSGSGQQITVMLYASECSDGMSEHKYPMTAEVVLFNEALRGCAAKASEFPKGETPAR